MPGCASVLVGLYGRSKKPPPRLGTRTITCCPAGSPSSCCLCGSANLGARAASTHSARALMVCKLLSRSIVTRCPRRQPQQQPVLNSCV